MALWSILLPAFSYMQAQYCHAMRQQPIGGNQIAGYQVHLSLRFVTSVHAVSLRTRILGQCPGMSNCIVNRHNQLQNHYPVADAVLFEKDGLY